MPEAAYDQVPYLTGPMPEMHPDRLAAVATLFGMMPPKVTGCRVLEIGCGDAGNLIPMAYRLPGSHFVGVDLAERAIAEGSRGAQELGLENLTLLAMDLRDIGESMGAFDYIITHGLYSWIPDELRDRLLMVCSERLSPQGVALISYNALPGRHVRIMLREMLLYHTRTCADPADRIAKARDLLRRLGDTHLAPSSWQPMLEDEIGQSLEGDASWFFHDDLAPINDAFYVRDFVDRARRHGFQFLGDAQPHTLFDSRASFDWVKGDVIEREQYFDFLCLRPFRQTLLCKAGVRLQRPPDPQQLDGLLFSSPARRSAGQIQGHRSVVLKEPTKAVSRVASAMAAVYPRPVSFDELLATHSDREALRTILFDMIASGFASFHTHRMPSASQAGRQPCVTRLARWESERSAMVTDASHTANRLDTMVRSVIAMLDGTRDMENVALALSRTTGAPSLAEIRTRLPQVINNMLYGGLLEGPPMSQARAGQSS